MAYRGFNSTPVSVRLKAFSMPSITFGNTTVLERYASLVTNIVCHPTSESTSTLFFLRYISIPRSASVRKTAGGFRHARTTVFASVTLKRMVGCPRLSKE